MIDLILFALLGIGIGIVCGLVPGLHINTIIPLLLSLTFLTNNPYLLAVLIVSIAVTQIFVGFIPSIFLGAPDSDNSLSVLPGHKMLLEGRGYEAIKLTVVGGVGSLFVTLILIFLFSSFFSYLYELSRPYVQYLILSIIFFMVLSERKIKKILFATAIILLSGFFGVITLSSSLVPQQNVLFPVLTGMFGLSTLIISINENSKIPEQNEDEKLEISLKNIFKSVFLGSSFGIIVGFLPAVGVSQAAVMAQYIGGMGEARTFLVTLSGINVANEIFSLISLYLVGNPRSGASVAIQKILTQLNYFDVLLFIGVIVFVSGIAVLLTLYLGKKIPKFLAKLNYRNLSLAIIIFILSIVLTITGLLGLLITFTSAAIGILCNQLGVRRSNCMGVLLLPSILFFSGFNPLIISILGV